MPGTDEHILQVLVRWDAVEQAGHEEGGKNRKILPASKRKFFLPRAMMHSARSEVLLSSGTFGSLRKVRILSRGLVA